MISVAINSKIHLLIISGLTVTLVVVQPCLEVLEDVVERRSDFLYLFLCRYWCVKE